MPQGNYFYSTVTSAKAQESVLFGTTFSTNAYNLIERFMMLKDFGGGKKDLVNGDRVYRVHSNNIGKLDLDALGRRFIPTRLGNFYFSEVLSSGAAFKDDTWLPVGI